MTKVPLADMAEVCFEEAWTLEGHIERWHRLNPNDPLPPDHHWLQRKRKFAAARLTLGLLALDEDASRKFINKLIEAHPEEAELWIAMR